MHALLRVAPMKVTGAIVEEPEEKVVDTPGSDLCLLLLLYVIPWRTKIYVLGLQ